MTTTDSKTEGTRDLKALYSAATALRGCRTCGIMGWDNNIQGR